MVSNNKIIGAIFCHVIKINLLIQDSPSITVGNQKWKGAMPTLIIRGIEIKIDLYVLSSSIIYI